MLNYLQGGKKTLKYSFSLSTTSQRPRGKEYRLFAVRDPLHLFGTTMDSSGLMERAKCAPLIAFYQLQGFTLQGGSFNKTEQHSKCPLRKRNNKVDRSQRRCMNSAVMNITLQFTLKIACTSAQT